MSGSGDASERMTLRAQWVIPVAADPIEQGVVEIAGREIVAVRPSRSREPGVVDLGDTAIIPGLVNAHAHLEFSTLTRPLEPRSPFAEWIRSVVAWRRSRTGTVTDAVSAGLRESAAAGVTTIGEIATPGWSPEVFNSTTPRGVLFRESIALDEANVDAELQAAAAFRQQIERTDPVGDVRYGFSPHAPYSVHPRLFRELVTMAAGCRAPLAFHLAETREELDAIRFGSGPLVDAFRASGFWRDGVIPEGTRPLDYLHAMAQLPHGLVVHGNYLDEEEFELLAGCPGLTVVYCPRTHDWFGHPPHPWLRLMQRGVRVALGTDGRSSNPDLSLWSEMLFLRDRFPDVAASSLLRLGTVNGAEALGMCDQIGTLQPGRRADLAMVQVCRDGNAEPYGRLLNPASRIKAVMRDGRWISELRP